MALSAANVKELFGKPMTRIPLNKSVLPLLGLILATVVIIWLTVPGQAGNYVEVPVGMQACAQDSECVTVGVTCDSCCNYEALNKSHRQDYQEKFRQQCQNWHGPVCNCRPAPGWDRPVCRQGRCQVITEEQTPLNKEEGNAE